MCKRGKKEAYLIQTFDDVHHWALRPKTLYLQQVLNKQAKQAYSDNMKAAYSGSSWWSWTQLVEMDQHQSKQHLSRPYTYLKIARVLGVL